MQSSCTERAQYIMEQAMRKGKYRWGVRAERIAGASVCVALREGGKAETVREVAVHIQCREDQLARVYRQLTSLLGIKLEPLDPALLVPSIWNHTQDCLASPAPAFPPQLSKFLNDMTTHTQAVLSLALQLSNLILRVSLTQGRQPPLVACALLMVSLSGEAGKPIPKPNLLASTLATRFGGTARSIADRVREIERVVEDWRLELPWAQTDLPTNSKKRTIKIASWIKDVVRFKDDLWSKQVDTIEHARYSPSTEGDSDEELDDNSSYAGSCSAAGSKRSSNGTHSTSGSKRRYLDAGYYDSGRPRAYVVESCKSRPDPQTTVLASLLNPETTSITANPSELDATRSGLKDRGIDLPDEELFEDGELEGLIRSNPEVEALRARWEEEKRFEGIPDWSDEPQEAALDSSMTDEPGARIDDGAEEIIGEWRDMSPSRFGNDDSYFYED